MTRPPVAALMLMSGMPRWLPTASRTPFWNAGRSKTAEVPPPAPLHTTSGEVRLPASSRVSRVPPIEVTSGSDDGQMTARNGKQQLVSASSAAAPAGVDVRAPQAEDGGGVRERLLRGPEALRHHVAEAVIDDEVLGLHDLREALHSLGLGLGRLDQQDP